MEARHKAPSRARENRPFAGQESPLSSQPTSLGTIRQLETENLKLESRRSIARPEGPVPHPVPDCTALYGLNRDKKINYFFQNVKRMVAFALWANWDLEFLWVFGSLGILDWRGISHKSRTSFPPVLQIPFFVSKPAPITRV